MSLSKREIASRLEEFGLDEYVTTLQEGGRAQMSADRRREAAELYDQIVGLRVAESYIPREFDDVLELAERFLYPEWFMAREPKPRYRAYTNVGILNWYLSTVHRTPYQQIWARCAAAIQLLLDDLLSFEVNSLAGLESRGAESFDEEVCRARVRHLKEMASGLVGDSGAAGAWVAKGAMSWEGYATPAGQDLALIRLTAFPQTTEHDEYLFLRTIHISECCFWGVLTSVLATVESLKRREVDVAARCLAPALPFARLLTPLFQTLKTMPPENFRGFRDATGNASAVQSRTYQLMQIALLGVNRSTIALITGTDDLQDLSAYDHPSFTSLAHLLAELEVQTQPAEELQKTAADLDRELRKWRTLHLGIARNYLADLPEGTGGTSGASYLKLSVQKTIRAAEEAIGSRTQQRESELDDHVADPLWPEEHLVARRLPRAAVPYLSRDN